MKSKLFLFFAANLLVALLVSANAVFAGGAVKVDVCHVDGNGTYHKINISENAFQSHVDHGDASPGDLVPGDPTMKFADDCSMVPAGPLVEPGFSFLTAAAGVRYKANNSGNEIYLGTNLGSGYPFRVEAAYPTVYSSWIDGAYAISFSFDQSENSVSTAIDGPGGAQSLAYDFDLLEAPGCAVASWNVMDVLIRDSRSDGGAALENVTFNGFALGNLGTVDVAGTPGFQNWTISGADFTQDFTVSADLVVQNYVGNEALKVEFNVGCAP